MKNSTIRLLIPVVCSMAVALSGCGGSPAHTQRWSSPPAMQIDTSKTYYAVFNTSMGSFKIKLFAAEAPKTVNNFVFLARQKFYDGTIFHRIIKPFMIQGGDPLGTGMGGPGYNIPDELPVKYSYDPGIIAMANTGRANTGGSQFFICTGTDAASLNKSPIYTQFGKVVEGMDVVLKIAAVPVVSANGEVSKPVKPPVIKTITIEES
ncbi:MAG: peptidylprolyl isomerase [Dehalococcoidia bacterium]|nr:MAG: peptidylprolyl isomerase [Dehalococcoidia bacterium]